MAVAIFGIVALLLDFAIIIAPVEGFRLQEHVPAVHMPAWKARGREGKADNIDK